MAVYQESLELDMSMSFSSDTYVPVQLDLMKLLPEKDFDKIMLTTFVDVMSNLTGEWLYKIKDIATGLDPHYSGDTFISHLSKVIGFPLFDEEGVPLADKRRQLTRAVDAYKQKGSYQGLKGMLRTICIVSEIKDMFVKKEVLLDDTKANYNDFDKHTVSDWFTGNNPPALTDYFKTPHFFVNIFLTTLYNPGVTESLWNSVQERKLNSVIELMRPINTWPYKNLFMEFYHSYCSGGVSTYNPNIYSCYIDRRPFGCIKLNGTTLESVYIVDNDGFLIKNNDGDYIIEQLADTTSAWYLNKGVKLNYHQNPERLSPEYYLLGKQNKPFYTFFDSFVGAGDVPWKEHSPDYSFYEQRRVDPYTVCKVKEGYLYFITTSLSAQKDCHLDLFDKNIILTFRAWVDSYASAVSIQSYGCIAQFNYITEVGVKYYIINDINNDWVLKVEMFNPGGSYELVSEPVDSPNMGWNNFKIIVRGHYSDIYINSKAIALNVYTGEPAKMHGWEYSTRFVFISNDRETGYVAKFKDLGIIKLGNQGQDFVFDSPERIISDNFSGVNGTSLDGCLPKTSYYNETWSDVNGILIYYNLTSWGNSVQLDCSSHSSTDAYIKLTETRLRIQFCFYYKIPLTAGDIMRRGCWLSGVANTLKENIKIYVEHTFANNPRVKMVKYEADTEKTQHVYLDEVIDINNIDTGGSVNNKFIIYLQEDRIKVCLNDYYKWDVSLIENTSPTYTMNSGTLFGFFVKDTNYPTTRNYFTDLEIWRYGLAGAKDISSSVTLLEDNFDDVDDTLLKNHVPDSNNTGDVWHDPDDAWKIFGNVLLANTIDKAKIMNSYIDIGKKNVDVTVKFTVPHPSVNQSVMGIMVRGNSDSKKAFQYSFFDPSGSDCEIQTSLCLDNAVYRVLSNTQFPFEGTDIVLRIMFRKNNFSIWRKTATDDNYFILSIPTIEDNLGHNLSLWWNPDFTAYMPSFTYLKIEEVIDEEVMISESDKIYGDMNTVHNEPEKKYEFDFTVQRNLEFFGISEVAFLAGDGKTVVGGATFPTIDKHVKETLRLKGDVQYGTP